MNEKGELVAVEKYLSDNILQLSGKAVSIGILQKIDMTDRRCRYKLKKKLFPGRLLFLSTKLNTTEIVVSAKNVSS